MTIREARMILQEYYENTNPSEEDEFLYTEALKYLIEETKDPDRMVELGAITTSTAILISRSSITSWPRSTTIFTRSRTSDTSGITAGPVKGTMRRHFTISTEPVRWET